ncbi:acylphosphatase-1-like [Stylophora pistillata]|uniref:acylphosphatase n=1 Tax=Stylophora pistillata TaxID=50429 RepID=A0A2B4S5N5_STYPI|nr:acylphosphatase-1-like [Stylophora pistillata]PFX24110.1 Acylphosphatase-1 [Stylophora pistillata]
MAAGKTVSTLCSVDFEVFGKVQGVFFRKYTRINATKHELVGWVMNTPHNTVVGQLQGETANVRLMRKWLRVTGSPKSRIDRCEFKNEKTISVLEFSEFTIKK